MNESQFIEYLKINNIDIDEKQLALFKKYYELLIDYNKKMNLTSITEKDEVYLKHFYDSLTLIFNIQIAQNSTFCDVGAGAGFPSVPLKIIRPDLNITIVDSLGKRINFLNELFNELSLKKIVAINSRAEDFAINNRETFDFVTARAVARLNILSELCIPLVKESGKFIAMKGQTGQEELEEANNAINKLGCNLLQNQIFSLPFDGGMRNIIILSKICKTPDKYPRNYSQIKNKPL